MDFKAVHEEALTCIRLHLVYCVRASRVRIKKHWEWKVYTRERMDLRNDLEELRKMGGKRDITNWATGHVMRYLQRDKNGENGSYLPPVGGSFNLDRLEDFKAQAMRWLAEHSELSTKTIESADYGEALKHFRVMSRWNEEEGRMRMATRKARGEQVPSEPDKIGHEIRLTESLMDHVSGSSCYQGQELPEIERELTSLKWTPGKGATGRVSTETLGWLVDYIRPLADGGMDAARGTITAARKFMVTHEPTVREAGPEEEKEEKEKEEASQTTEPEETRGKERERTNDTDNLIPPIPGARPVRHVATGKVVGWITDKGYYEPDGTPVIDEGGSRVQ